MRFVSSVALPVVGAVLLTPAVEGACRVDLLEHNAAHDVNEELRDARRKFGCKYSGLDCSFATSATSYVTGDCTLVKSRADGADSTGCQPQLLTRELERDLAKDFAKAKLKFGCNDVRALTCDGGNGGAGRLSCSIDSTGDGSDGNSARSASSSRKAAAPAGAGSACDVGILSASVEHELVGKVSTAQGRYGCPAIASVSCTVAPSTKWVDCDLSISDTAAVPATCNLDFLTQSVSADIGEELAEAEAKYGCPVPSLTTCTPVSPDSPVLECALDFGPGPSSQQAQTGRAQQAGGDGVDDNGDGGARSSGAGPTQGGAAPPGRRNFHFRHHRVGGHGSL